MKGTKRPRPVNTIELLETFIVEGEEGDDGSPAINSILMLQ